MRCAVVPFIVLAELLLLAFLGVGIHWTMSEWKDATILFAEKVENTERAHKEDKYRVKLLLQAAEGEEQFVTSQGQKDGVRVSYIPYKKNADEVDFDQYWTNEAADSVLVDYEPPTPSLCRENENTKDVIIAPQGQTVPYAALIGTLSCLLLATFISWTSWQGLVTVRDYRPVRVNRDEENPDAQARAYPARPVHVSEADVDAFLTTEIETVPDTCVICLDEFESESGESGSLKPVALRCGHVYHDQCIKKWLVSRHGSRCPTCNASVAPSETTDGEEVSEVEV